MKNSKHQGDVGLGIAIAWFAANGYMVSIPLTDSQDYDLVIDDDITLRRVQVRTTYHKRASGFYAVTLKVTGGNRSGAGKTKYIDPNKVHLLFVVTDKGEKYLFPTDKLDCKSSITLYEKYDVFRVE